MCIFTASNSGYMFTADCCSKPWEEDHLLGHKDKGQVQGANAVHQKREETQSNALSSAKHPPCLAAASNSVPKGNSSATHPLLDACKNKYISSIDSPEIDVKDTEDRSMLLIKHHGPSHANKAHSQGLDSYSALNEGIGKQDCFLNRVQRRNSAGKGNRVKASSLLAIKMWKTWDQSANRFLPCCQIAT